MGRVELEAELAQIAAAASELGDDLAAVIPTEPQPGRRVYLCAYETEPRSWLALDADGTALSDRSVVRAAVSVAALAELAEESAGGGKLEDLRRELVGLSARRRGERGQGVHRRAGAQAGQGAGRAALRVRADSDAP